MDILRLPRVRFILSFTVTTFLAFSLLQASFPLYARRNLFPYLTLETVQRNIGLLLTWFGIISVVMQSFFVGALVRRYGERLLIVMATFGRIVAFLGISFSRNPIVTSVMFLPLAMGNAVSQPSLQSILSRFARPEMRGRLMGAFQSANSLTLIVGPLLAGTLMAVELPSLSPQTATALPMFTAAGLVSIAFLMSFRILRMELPSQEIPRDRVGESPIP